MKGVRGLKHSFVAATALMGVAATDLDVQAHDIHLSDDPDISQTDDVAPIASDSNDTQKRELFSDGVFNIFMDMGIDYPFYVDTDATSDPIKNPELIKNIVDFYQNENPTFNDFEISQAIELYALSPNLMKALTDAGLDLKEISETVASSFETNPPIKEGHALAEQLLYKYFVISEDSPEKQAKVTANLAHFLDYTNYKIPKENFIELYLLDGQETIYAEERLDNILKMGAFLNAINIFDSPLEEQDILAYYVFSNFESHSGPYNFTAGPPENYLTAIEQPNILDLSEFYPSKNAEYFTLGQTLTLREVAQNTLPLMDVTNVEEARLILADANEIDLTQGEKITLPQWESIMIPLAPHIEMVFEDVSEEKNTSIDYMRELPLSDQDGKELDEINKLSLRAKAQQFFLGQTEIPDYGHFAFPITPDEHGLEPLTTPDNHAPEKVTLYVTEQYNQYNEDEMLFGNIPHLVATYSAARDFKLGTFPDHEGLEISALNTTGTLGIGPYSDQLFRTYLDRDSTVFSLSLQSPADKEYYNKTNLKADRMQVDYFRHHHPNIIISAGNEHNDTRNLFVATPHSAGRNSFIIAAAHGSEGKSHIAPYSSIGASFTGPDLIRYNGKDVYGTSFNTPTTGTIATGFLSWYGDNVSFEEIMYAGMMSTDISVDDCNASLSGSACENNETHPSLFKINASGIPFHPRGGAGQINPALWQENIEQLIALKKEKNLETTPISATVTYSDMSQRAAESFNGGIAYNYAFKMPIDMTLGKIVIETEPDTKYALQSPDGQRVYLGGTIHSHLSTHALALEKRDTSDTFILTTNKPLPEDFKIHFDGQAPGNALDALRDDLASKGKLYEPLSNYVGGELSTDAFVMQPPLDVPVYVVNTPISEDELKPDLEINPLDLNDLDHMGLPG